ncbi:hypothetical protein [Crocosphaera sp.]|uniref:hypothetical protein n=1 Tax=Crocosphaera sp. TaxID=2729996 RepID=UPI00260A9EDD|nr:hypothetical protein [Crocosphaera sp.]MDJ0580752.1 hypothetical protein [Crocosphaera sp.]
MSQSIQTRNTIQTIQPKYKHHKYVFICMGAFMLIVASFPMAVWRVSQSNKYNSGAFNSWTLEESQKSQLNTQKTAKK